MSVGKYAVPSEIRMFQPSDIPTLVKNVNGRYYVYEHKRVRDENTGKMKNASGKVLGRITAEEGFIPNNVKIEKDDITILNFGEYAVSVQNSQNTLVRLKQFFGTDDAYRIYCMAVIYFVNGYTSISHFKAVYDQSWLSARFKDVSLSEESAGNFLKELGRRQTRVEAFEQSLINEGSGIYAVDGHVILSCSRLNDMTAYGNKYQKLHNTQQNFMCMFDVEENRPVAVKAFDGGTVDKTAVRDIFKTHQFHDTVFIVDSGFYSAGNIQLFSDKENHYVIPVPENMEAHKTMIKDIRFTDEFVYKKGKGRKTESCMIRYREEIIKNRRIIMFQDETMNEQLRAEYYSLIGIDDDYTLEEYRKQEQLLGIIILETNMSVSAEEVYETYKKRWRIETYYNHMKNSAGFNGTHKQNYYELQGESFIMAVEGMIYSEFMNAINNSTEKILKGKCSSKCLRIAAYQKIARHDDESWHKNSLRKGVTELIEALGVDTDQYMHAIS